MGTFMGHILPGGLFILFGMWWTLNMFMDYYKSKCKNGKSFYNKPWYPGPGCHTFPIESTLKILVATIGMLGDSVAFGMSHEPIRNFQHITMYFFFGLNGVMDLLKYYSFVLPNGIEIASGLIAYVVECFVFLNHLHGRQQLEVQVHKILICIIVACILSLFLESQYRNCVIPSLSRAFTAILQGSWFCQIAFILYSPFGLQISNWKNHEQMMIVSLIFTWHIAVDFVLMLILGGCVWVYLRVSH